MFKLAAPQTRNATIRRIAAFHEVELLGLLSVERATGLEPVTSSLGKLAFYTESTGVLKDVGSNWQTRNAQRQSGW